MTLLVRTFSHIEMLYYLYHTYSRDTAANYVRLTMGPVFEWWSENRTEKSLFVAQNVWY